MGVAGDHEVIVNSLNALEDVLLTIGLFVLVGEGDVLHNICYPRPSGIMLSMSRFVPRSRSSKSMNINRISLLIVWLENQVVPDGKVDIF